MELRGFLKEFRTGMRRLRKRLGIFCVFSRSSKEIDIFICF